MGQPVELNVRSQLKKVVDDLQKISEAAKQVSNTAKELSDSVGDGINNNTKKTETFLDSLSKLGGRVAKQLKGDFQALFALNAIAGATKISEQFGGAIKDTISLNDAVRKLGTTLGVSQSNFAKFQSYMTRGMGEIGLSGETAAQALQGLAHTQVRGDANLLEYSKLSGQVASVGGQKGQEAQIAQGLADVIRARGGNVNDVSQAKALGEELRKIFNATGQSPTETLKAMEEMFTHMSSDLRKKLGPDAVGSLATAGAVAGPNATKFLEEYLSKSPIQRMAMDAQGMKNVFGPKGLNLAEFAKVSKNILGRVGGDPRLAAQTLGISEDAAEGFVRLSKSLNEVKSATDRAANSTGTLGNQYENSMTMGEAFRANMNHVMGNLSKGNVLGHITQGITSTMSKAAQGDAASVGIVAGGGVLSALLAGAGIKTIGGLLLNSLGIGGGAAAGAGAAGAGLAGGAAVGEGAALAGGAALAAEGTAAVAGGGLLAAAAPALAIAGGIAAVGAGGAYLASKMMGGPSDNANAPADEKTMFIQLMQRIDALISVLSTRTQQKVHVELNKRELKDAKQPSRGGSY